MQESLEPVLNYIAAFFGNADGLTIAVLAEYQSLTEEERQRLIGYREMVTQPLTNEPFLHDLGCLASMVRPSENLNPARLMTWMKDRVRGFNRSMQDQASTVALQLFQSLGLLNELPAEVAKLWIERGLLDEGYRKKSQLEQVQAIVGIVKAHRLSDKEREQAVAALSTEQAAEILDKTLDWLKQHPKLLEYEVLDYFIRDLIEHHTEVAQQRSGTFAKFPTLHGILRGFHFLHASTETRDELLQQAITSPNLNGTLFALAWLGDDVVSAKFQEWDTQDWWKHDILVPPSSFAHEAGWTVSSEGKRIDLFHPISYELEVVREEQEADLSAFVADTIPCNGCFKPMRKVLDAKVIRKFFPELGPALHPVMICETCWSEPEGCRIDWSHYTTKGNRKETHRVEEFPTTHYRAGSKQIHARPDWKSRLGGCPYWVQDSALPRCSRCEQYMYFLAQFDYGDGLVYAFTCKTCPVTASSYQFS